MIGPIVIGIILLYILRFYHNVRRYPKGPMPLPLIGNFHQVKPEDLHLFFEECHAKYGDIFTVWTPRPMVVIMEYEHIREALIKNGDAFLGRNHGFPECTTMVIPNGGITFAEGESWARQRKASVAILKQFGMGGGFMENQVRQATEAFVSHLESLSDLNHVDFRWPIQIFVANVINKMLFNYEYDYEGSCKRLMRIADLFTYLVEDARSNPLVLFSMQYEWLEQVPIIGWRAVGKYRDIIAKMHAHIREDISECMERFNTDDDPDCFVHAYKKMAEDDPKELNDDQLVNVCLDLFLAGMETVSTTLRWAVLYLAKHQSVQSRIRDEIRLLCPSGSASMGDRIRLPFTSATIHEIQRTANMIPQNIAKRTLRNVEISGVFIPEDTLVQTQFYNVHKYGFENPEEFRPERFLSEDGNSIDKQTLDYLAPFGMGKRVCAGESLARCELFMLVTSLVTNFHVHPPVEGEIDLSPIPAVFLLPHTNLLRVIPLRKK
uniref:Cytochrome P450 n=1 Tax=Pristionchus pacificus TaxID=54126 RepID=A0A8R1Y5Q6_PRIPA